jgi:hypothetical protein
VTIEPTKGGSRAESLARRYDKRPLLRALVQLIPFGVGSAIDTGVSVHLQNLVDKRRRIFFDELAAAELPLTEEMIENEDFLHFFFATEQAAERARREEKIVYFARLLASAFSGTYSDLDEYEEFFSILEDLSYRELRLLILLRDVSKEHAGAARGSRSEPPVRMWEDYLARVESEMRIARDEVVGLLTRASRSGCVKEISGTRLGYAGGQFELTPLFDRLAAAIVENTETKTR